MGYLGRLSIVTYIGTWSGTDKTALAKRVMRSSIISTSGQDLDFVPHLNHSTSLYTAPPTDMSYETEQSLMPNESPVLVPEVLTFFLAVCH